MSDAPRAAPGEDAALTYRRLRAIIGALGLTLPVTCLLTGLVDGHLEASISDYYYSGVTIVFTGTLFAIGVFLVAYRFGTLVFEGVATTVAGVAALGVAFFHTPPVDATLRQLRLGDVHVASAAVLFVLLGVISLLVFPSDVPPGRWEARTYRVLGALILFALALIAVLNATAHGFLARVDGVFALESVAVIAFAVSFLLKGRSPGLMRS